MHRAAALRFDGAAKCRHVAKSACEGRCSEAVLEVLRLARTKRCSCESRQRSNDLFEKQCHHEVKEACLGDGVGCQDAAHHRQRRQRGLLEIPAPLHVVVLDRRVQALRVQLQEETGPGVRQVWRDEQVGVAITPACVATKSDAQDAGARLQPAATSALFSAASTSCKRRSSRMSAFSPCKAMAFSSCSALTDAITEQCLLPWKSA